MDLINLTTDELRELQQQIPVELKRRESQEKNDAIAKLRAMAKTLGYSLEDLVDKENKARGASGAGSKVKVKYRHPENPEMVWTGRGLTPKWVKSWLETGATLESLKV